ncbi:hypothetical protein RISW2_17030 [Roseivivax isoporae LMG 25204]|uniref:Uncharacterized protein n=1 Tax=Roseivivax isoporae LMG 25204 TaxID=1449351 RepID=X7F4N7_9RHOB|nr:hypothetical protein RISW2_17030 [Roseivivax isoporae LMG 25204]
MAGNQCGDQVVQMAGFVWHPFETLSARRGQHECRQLRKAGSLTSAIHESLPAAVSVASVEFELTCAI